MFEIRLEARYGEKMRECDIEAARTILEHAKRLAYKTLNMRSRNCRNLKSDNPNFSRAALDHNAAVISSCLFTEAIVSMLLKISPAAILQLGFHMGLFIAKPKGKKIAIAESFAKRLIKRRDLHTVKSASVHTSNTQHTSINASSIPDNVKFFETKHGQLAFMFTDDLVFSD